MSTLNWDYTALAGAYADRPDYAPAAVDVLLDLSGAVAGDRACDVGAGSGHLTLPLLSRGLLVDAVEPNAQMRALGGRRSRQWPSVRWFDATAEETGRPADRYRLVTFGSSFNVAEPGRTLPETARILDAGGWFACLWNHRILTDPLQAAIEQLIRRRVPDYTYGARRSDQSAVIAASTLFGPVHRIEETVLHRVEVAAWCAAWRSHATLARQAGADFPVVVDEITDLVHSVSTTYLDIPYATRGWAAPVRVVPARVRVAGVRVAGERS